MTKEWRTEGKKGASICKLAVEELFWRLPNAHSHCPVSSRGKLFLYSLAQKPAWCWDTLLYYVRDRVMDFELCLFNGNPSFPSAGRQKYYVCFSPEVSSHRNWPQTFQKIHRFHQPFFLKCHILPLLNISLDAGATGGNTLTLAKPRWD